MILSISPSFPSFFRPGPRLGAYALTVGLFGCLANEGCRARSSTESAPFAALADSRSAQEVFRPLKQRFVSSERSQRKSLEPNLIWFVQAYPKDGLAPLARIYLALIAVDRGDVDRARQLIRAAGAGPSGTTRDLAELVEGFLLLRQSDPAQAFERFLPMVGKLIDPYARMLLDESIVAAAIGARRWYEAVAYMDLWLRDAPEDEAVSVQAQVKRSLEAVPSAALELMLKAMGGASRSGYGAEIRRAVVARLAAVALDKQDTELARRLVDSTDDQALGDAAEGLEELAASGGAPTVDGRTMGLLVSTGKSQLGVRAAEVLTGVVDALRLMGGGGADHVRLTTRDERDTKRTELALLALASHGASVLIAGFDPLQAEIAAKFAERTRIPVILLSALADGRLPPPPAFVLGESADKVALLLIESIKGKGVRSMAAIGGSLSQTMTAGLSLLEPGSCSAPASQAGESRFPLEAWRKARLDYLLLLGDAPCASDAIDDIVAEKLGRVHAAVGLEAAQIAAEPSRVPLLVVTAGGFPLLAGGGASPLSGFRDRHGKAPSWFSALGHDAAVLARAALRSIPLDRVDDSAKVAKRHELARAALARAEGELWSTEVRGFAGLPAMARDLKTVEVK